MTIHNGVRPAPSLLGQQDLYLFNEGSHIRLYDHVGAHLRRVGDVEGCSFAVWAPGANYVAVIGDFNGWDNSRHALVPRGESGIWEGFIPGVRQGSRYKFFIGSPSGFTADKIDPFGFYHEVAPDTASIVWDLGYRWNDGEWMASRRQRNSLQAPVSSYEVHLGSWRHAADAPHRSLSY